MLRLIKRKLKSPRLLYNIYLPGRDLLSCFRDPRRFPLHRRLGRIMKEQRRNWPNAYTGNYYYQGFRRIGINGVKPTEDRVSNYEIIPLLQKDQRLLDIGSNCGFMSLYLAEFVDSVEGIELNPYLNRIASEVQQFLKINNSNFVTEDFSSYTPESRFDVVLSLSNHHTIDGNLDMNFETYVKKIFDLVNPGGLLFFESHNVFGDQKTGKAGDDTDLDEKFDIVERYFEVVRFRMVPRFHSPDIDKLFVILTRRPEYCPDAKRTLSLVHARTRYSY